MEAPPSEGNIRLVMKYFPTYDISRIKRSLLTTTIQHINNYHGFYDNQFHELKPSFLSTKHSLTVRTVSLTVLPEAENAAKS